MRDIVDRAGMEPGNMYSVFLARCAICQEPYMLWMPDTDMSREQAEEELENRGWTRGGWARVNRGWAHRACQEGEQ